MGASIVYDGVTYMGDIQEVQCIEPGQCIGCFFDPMDSALCPRTNTQPIRMLCQYDSIFMFKRKD